MKKYIIIGSILLIIGVTCFLVFNKKLIINEKISEEEIRSAKSINMEFLAYGEMIPFSYKFSINEESATLEILNNWGEVEKSVNLTSEDVTILKDALIVGKVNKWDGFNGEDPGVLDGEMFSFKVVIDGVKISASGSNNFPKGYFDFKNKLHEIISKYDIIE